MTVVYDASYRQAWPHQSSATALCLEDKFEVLKEIGDGSFGSVALARVRSAGANVARRGTLVAVKTMKKTFDSFNHCLELREVIFLRSLPAHQHLVPALDIFLDPMTKKLHIAMEYMDGNLYQLMKARDHKYLDGSSVKSILFQIISGLEHIHHHNFFHRDIKPENILVSTSAPQDTSSAFKRYSALVTPPSTPPAYTVKIADFGLARETHSKLPYTTYVSTRWYRAPEVLLRAGEYFAPVDIWAVGAMAVEIATLKPLFPGGNEVDQVWRICEIMGSPGNWQNRHGARVGGGEWKDGVKLAQKLGFSFPKMAPHTLDTILRPPQWPASLSDFVTWCLMWDPKGRPTSTQALAHDYFKDALDPLRPKSSSKLLGNRKQSSASTNDSFKDAQESLPSLTTKTSSWFRKSLIQREVSAPAVPQHTTVVQPASPSVQTVVAPAPAPAPPPKPTVDPNATVKARPAANKRATWTNGLPSNAAPIPILPTIRPISPLSDAVTAQATVRPVDADDKAARKIGRQLSTNSQTNHYAEIHRQEAERALNGQSGLASPASGHRESFFSHLRKRARRFSGKYQAPLSPSSDDIEANAGCSPWQTNSNRQSMVIDGQAPLPTLPSNDFSDLDKALQNVRQSLEASSQATSALASGLASPHASNHPSLKRQHSVPRPEQRPTESTAFVGLFGRSRSTRNKHQPSLQYETPDEEDELLDEALNSAHKAARRLDRHTKQENQYTTPKYPPVPSVPSQVPPSMSYLTPSPSADRSIGYDYFKSASKPLDILKPKGSYNNLTSQWPTPPSDSEWAASAAASIFAAGAAYR